MGVKIAVTSGDATIHRGIGISPTALDHNM